MNTSDARNIIAANAEGIKRFVTNYLLDVGIGVQLLEIVTKELFGHVDVTNETTLEAARETPRGLLGGAMQDIMHMPMFGDPEYDLERVLDGAASFELLVRYARLLSPDVMPVEIIPTNEVVKAALAIFHKKKATVVAE